MKINGHDRAARKHDELLDNILTVNGFNAIKAQILGAAQAAAGVPQEAFEAALRYTDQAIDRLRLDLDPRAKAALEQAEYERALITATLSLHRAVAKVNERLEARRTITAG